MSMTKDTKPEATLVGKMGMHLLRMRVSRMVRLLELDAPTLVLCKEAALIFQAACVINPQLTGQALAESIRTRQAVQNNICHYCLNVEVAPGVDYCPACIEEFQKAADGEGEPEPD